MHRAYIRLLMIVDRVNAYFDRRPTESKEREKKTQQLAIDQYWFALSGVRVLCYHVTVCST